MKINNPTNQKKKEQIMAAIKDLAIVIEQELFDIDTFAEEIEFCLNMMSEQELEELMSYEL